MQETKNYTSILLKTLTPKAKAQTPHLSTEFWGNGFLNVLE